MVKIMSNIFKQPKYKDEKERLDSYVNKAHGDMKRRDLNPLEDNNE